MMWHAYLAATPCIIAKKLPKKAASVGPAFLNARYYDSARGQFLSEDPVFWEVGQTQDGKSVLTNPQAMNSYGYANGNPVVNKDPSGRCLEDGCAAEITIGSLAIRYGPAALATAGAGISTVATYAGDVIQNREQGNPNPYTSNLSTPATYITSALSGAASLTIMPEYRIVSGISAAGSSLLQNYTNNEPLNVWSAGVAGVATMVTGTYFTNSISKVASQSVRGKVAGEIFQSASVLVSQHVVDTNTSTQKSQAQLSLPMPVPASRSASAIMSKAFPNAVRSN